MINSNQEPLAEQGLKKNWRQFTLLVVLNAFVGGVIGMERSILPQMAQDEFGMAVKTAILTFIIAFGVVKAIANLYTGVWADRLGRKNLLLLGWAIGLPAPFMLIYAPDWNWVIAANVLLGAHQGIAWSATVMMKADLAGPEKRGLAMGLNEFAGYIAVAVSAFLTGWLAHRYGLRPYPFYLGIGLIATGFWVTLFFVKDTLAHLKTEAHDSKILPLKNVFWDTSLRNHNLSAVTVSGLVNNLNDGMVWGLLPIFLLQKGFSLMQIGFLAAVYPAVWGTGQLLTGFITDKVCKKDMILWGMVLQGLALAGLAFANDLASFTALLTMLGWGTAMVYPTFLASIAENTHPADRAKSLGIFRFWRDLGYAAGALSMGIMADLLGIPATSLITGVLTFFTGVYAYRRMSCVVRSPSPFIWFRQQLQRILMKLKFSLMSYSVRL